MSKFIIAQCPPHDMEEKIILKSQEQVDSLLLDYPYCSFIKNLEISVNRSDVGTPIHNLEPLSQLRSIEGKLSIIRERSNNSLPALENLNGLHNLSSLESIIIKRDKYLTNLKELNQISRISSLELRDAIAISEIAIPNLHISLSLKLRNAQELTNIEGVTMADEIDSLVIDNVPKLNLQNQLNNITTVNKTLHLNHHDVAFVSNIEEVGHLIFYGNGPVQDTRDFESIKRIKFGLELNALEALEDLSTFHDAEFTDSFSTLHLSHNQNLKTLTAPIQSEELTSLHLIGSPLLNEVIGLDRFREIAFMLIHDTGLEDCSAFKGLEKVLAYIGVSNNQNLTTLNGLGALRNIERQLVISGNNKLVDLDGLSNLTSIGNNKAPGNFINISDNTILSSIHSLAGTFARLESLRIENNPELSICHLQLICQHILDGKATIINGNAPGCSSIKETEDQCNFPVFQKVFLDQDENGELENEPGLKIGHTVYNDSYRLYPDNNGVINLSPFDGEINLDYITQEHWYTTTKDSYAFPDSENVDPMFIGIAPSEEIYDLRIHLNYNPIICSQDYYLSMIIHNSGTTIVQTEISLDGVGEYIAASTDPTTVDMSTITFEFQNLLPGQTKKINMLYQAPNIADVPLGTLLQHDLKYKVYNSSDDFIYENEKRYQLELLCAYDPNDKQVFPAGVGEENKTQKTEELQYLIRFQNTGNYYAEDITIRDTLSESLDLTTFQFIGASHPISEIKMERNALAFVFENIFLPDSIRNEPKSHGYVSYSISPRVDIAENTLIENTAHIYFDSNPAIVTNTTSNTMVTNLNDNSSLLGLSNDSSLSVFPNPATKLMIIQAKKPIGDWRLIDTNGRAVITGNTNVSAVSIDLESVSSGLYFLSTMGAVRKVLID